MKKSQLKKIIKEEISKLLKEENLEADEYLTKSLASKVVPIRKGKFYKGGSISWHSEQSKIAIENLLKSYNLPYKINQMKTIGQKMGLDSNEVNFESKAEWSIEEEENFKEDIKSLAKQILVDDEFYGMDDVLYLPSDFFPPDPKDTSRKVARLVNKPFTTKNIRSRDKFSTNENK